MEKSSLRINLEFNISMPIWWPLIAYLSTKETKVNGLWLGTMELEWISSKVRLRMESAYLDFLVGFLA